VTEARELLAEETVESGWNYLLFRDGIEGPDVVLQGDSSKRVDGGGDSGESVELPSMEGQCRGV
jgi:hypothetical protein